MYGRTGGIHTRAGRVDAFPQRGSDLLEQTLEMEI